MGCFVSLPGRRGRRDAAGALGYRTPPCTARRARNIGAPQSPHLREVLAGREDLGYTACATKRGVF